MQINSYPSIYALGHAAIADLLKSPVIVEEKIDGCVAPETPILCRDLIYRRADSLSAGDEIIGVEYKDKRFRMCESAVTFNAPITKPCVMLETETRLLMCSADHPLLIRGHTRPGKSTAKTGWCEAQNLESGFEILSLPVWAWEKTWASGYLAGMFDGEGTVVGPAASHNTRRLAFYQKEGEEADLVEKLLKDRGFSVARDRRQRSQKWKVAIALSISGSGRWTEMLKFLGVVRPPRLLRKADKLWKDASTGYCAGDKVVAVKNLGKQTVMGLSTTSETYIANGLISHNSQFSFMKTEEGELICRSKGATINMVAPEGMFLKAVETLRGMLDVLPERVTFRGEYLSKPKHNVLCYGRVPANHIILFDINPDLEKYMPPDQKRNLALELGFEVVPTLFKGMINDPQEIRAFLELESILGGQKIEGVVIKPANYDLFGRDKKVLMGKFVSEAFKEVHAGEWKAEHATKGPKEIVQLLATQYATPARWQKALIHLREEGKITDSPKDIEGLMAAVPGDVLKECEAEIREKVFEWVWPQLRRSLTKGLPIWYKDELLKLQFLGH